MKNHVKELYLSSRADVWNRIEDELPDGLMETNVVEGRQRAAALLLRWMSPLADRRVLDLGCGRGHLAVQLADLGATVTGVDLLPRFRDADPPTTNTNVTFVEGDGFQLACKSSVNDVVIREVLEDYEPGGAEAYLKQLADCHAEQVFLILRVAGPLSNLWSAIAERGIERTVDPLSLLRVVHSHTPFRLKRQETVHVRNYRVWVVHLSRAVDTKETELVG